MSMNRRNFLVTSAAGAAILKEAVAAVGSPAGNLQVAIDAGKAGEPISPLVFGGYMEPATTRAWAEMLNDRKFAYPITAAGPSSPNRFMRRFLRYLWKPVGPENSVVMDTVRPWVGAHSPRIELDATAAHGIQQSGLHLGRGRSYVGRVYLAGDPDARVVVRLVWGTGATDSQTIQIPPLSQEYRKFSLQFTPAADAEDARLEILGTGSGTFHIGTASLMPADNLQGFHAGMIKLYKEAGFAMAKWPGGNFVSTYDWRDGLGDPDKRPPRIGPEGWPILEPNDVGIHEYIAFCRLLGAEPDMAVNSGFGDARSAAEEVEYANGPADTPMGKLRAENGHPEPFNVRLWCIGNEMYGPWQYGHMSLNQYWVKHNDFTEAMKKVDPKIQVTVCGATICEESWCAAEQNQYEHGMWTPPLLEKLPYKFGESHDWDGWLLDKCADNIDYLSEHTYAYPDMEFDAQKQRFVEVNVPLQVGARRMANRICAAFEAWQKYVEKMPSLKEKNIKFIFDEWGNRFSRAHGQFPFSAGMVSPLSFALFYHELFRHSDMVEASCPTAGFYMLVTDHTGEAVGLTVEGLVIKVMRAHFAGALPVEVSGNSPQRPGGGTPLVDTCSGSSGSPTYPLDVIAALSSDRKTLIVSVVNPTEAGQEFAPQIAGVKLRGPGTLWQIAAPNVNAANEPGKEPTVQIVEIPQKALPAKVQVPPISINVYEFHVEKA
jgi:alpha-N-arabinofuranosidase